MLKNKIILIKSWKKSENKLKIFIASLKRWSFKIDIPFNAHIHKSR